MKQKILRLPQVIEMTGLPRSTIYALIKDNAFPKQVPLGRRAVGWIEQEIQDWIDGKISTYRA